MWQTSRCWARCHPEALVALRILLASSQPVGQSFQQAPEVCLRVQSSETPLSSLSTSQGWHWFGDPNLLVSQHFLLCSSPLHRLVQNVATLVSLTVLRPREADRSRQKRRHVYSYSFVRINFFFRDMSNSAFST